MNSNRRPETKRKVRLALRARKFARENAVVVSVLAIVVVIGVTALFMRRVLAAKHQIRVLDCPVVHAVAHHHDDSCYDDEGNLICTLPERDVHVHDEGCFERKLVCDLEEGEGVHAHDESCYDEQGNLICGQEEGKGHVHTDDCYADVLTCGKDEVSEEHVHGDGCFRMVAANEDAVEYTHPEFTLSHDVYNKDKQLEMRVTAIAPTGALPQGVSMEVRLLDPNRVDTELVQQTLDEQAKKEQSSEAAKLLQWQGVDISFVDERGVEIQPSKDVTIKLTTDLAKSQAHQSVVRMEPVEKASKDGEKKQDENAPKATLLGLLSDEQLEARNIKLAEDQVAFDSDKSTTYVLITTSQRHEMEATDGSSVSILVNAPADAGLPADATLEVARVTPGTSEYNWYVDRSVEAMGADQADVAMAQFFDIHIVDSDGEEIEPQAPMDVTINLADTPDAPKDVAAVRFAQSEETMKAKLEQLDATEEGGVTSFSATDLNVCGVVYTVDFGYEVEGNLYEYTIKGGGSVGLRELVDTLHIHEDPIKAYENADAFMAEVADVEFSDAAYLWVQRVEGKTTLQDILGEYSLQPQYAAGTTEEQIAEWGKASYENDWVLASLAPFTTTEMLVITMTDGTQRLVVVTDAQDDGAIQPSGGTRAAGDTVTTIQNPADIRIDLIDYWVDDSLKYTPAISESNSNNNDNTRVWPNWGTDRQDVAGADDNIIPYGLSVIGTGWNKGINSSAPSTSGTYGEHNLKFNASNAHLVPDGVYENGRFSNLNNRTAGTMTLNSWTGSASNGADGPNPYQGIVTNKLNDAGYPTLVNDSSKGADGEPLNYLFDDSYHAGKQYYPNVNNLLVVDSNGYYVFDSAEYDAEFVPNTSYKPNYDPSTDDPKDAYSGSFKLTEQGPVPTNSNGNPNNNVNGFWPFGNRVYWHGMHVQADFSMPGTHNGRQGQVLNPRGEYEDMIFEFTGDDDTWVYIDGILVGDAGGVHNKTTISINFATGAVKVIGSDPNNPVTDTTLRAIFQAAQGNDFDASQWEGDTFAVTTHHEFDMFYLERGGGESNLKLKFNLITTADFNAHKVYNGKNNRPLKTDDFAFEMIGLDGECSYTLSGDSFSITPPGVDDEAYARRAVMPESLHATAQSIVEASVATPFYNANTSLALSDGTTATGQIYATGVQADGYVNFGTADTSDLAERMEQSNGQLHPAYRYVVREIIPDTAVNPNGKNWYECTEEERRQDGFVGTDPNSDLGILYSGETYYMVGYLKENDSGEYEWKKKYFTDDTYTTLGSVSFIDFKNRYATELKPVQLNLNKKNEQGNALKGAEFNLRKAMYFTDRGVWDDYPYGQPVPTGYGNYGTEVYDITRTTGDDGTLDFGNLQPGYYILEETVAPTGYELPRNMWLVTVRRVDWARLEDGSRKLYSKVTDNDRVLSLYSECEVEVSQLTLDGAEIPNTTVSKNVQEINNVPQFTQDVTNTQYQFNVEKRWEGIPASHSAIGTNGGNETQVEVTLGRYTIQDIAGTLNINKYGVPALANTTITYNVYKSENGAQGDLVAGPFTESAWNVSTTPDGTLMSIASISLPPGDYIVTQDVESDDPKYNATHPATAEAGDRVTIQGNTTIVTIEDEQVTEANFTSEYVPKAGKLYIKSNFTDNSGLVNPNTMGVTYTVTDNAGNDVYDVNGNKVGPFTYDDVMNGLETENVLIGRYRVTESGWTDVTGTVRTHDPAQSGGSTTISEMVTDGNRTDYEFTTAYEPKTSTDVYLVVYKYAFHYTDGQEDPTKPYIVTNDDVIAQYGPFSVEGDSFTVTFTIGTNDSYPTYPRLGNAYFADTFNARLSSTPAGDGWQTTYTGTINTSELGSGNVIYLGNRWGTGSILSNGVTLADGTSTWNLNGNSSYTPLSTDDTPGAGSRSSSDGSKSAESASSNGATKSRSVSLKATKAPAQTRGAATQRGIQPGTELVEKTNNAATPDNAGEGKKYVEDIAFGAGHVVHTDTNEGNVVVLTQADNDLDNTTDAGDTKWRISVKGLPSRDERGNKYYYYIKSVKETNLPKNTSCTIDLDGDDNKLLSFKPDDGSNAQTLSVTNKVGTPADIDLIKVEKNSDGTLSTTRLDGAVFRLQQKVTTVTPAANPDDDPTTSTDWVVVKDHKVVRADAQTTEIAVDQTTGDFTVPTGGATVLLLDPGDYRFVEVNPPDGYVMEQTDYEFTVGQDGTIPTANRPAHVTGDYEVTVGNTPGEELPMSGGPGTIVSTVAGVLLAVFGALTLLRNHRRTVEVEERS